MKAAADLDALVRALVDQDDAAARRILAAAPELATARYAAGATRQGPKPYFIQEIRHYIYAGDSALHMAAATHRPAIVKRLVALGADVHAQNRRGAEPLHYAVDGGPGVRSWNARAQAETVTALLAAGADPAALDKNGTTPLRRAVRNRCAAAVRALLEGGAEPEARAIELARMTTGKSGSGSTEAKAQQAEIVRLLTSPCSRRG